MRIRALAVVRLSILDMFRSIIEKLKYPHYVQIVEAAKQMSET